MLKRGGLLGREKSLLGKRNSTGVNATIIIFVFVLYCIVYDIIFIN